MSCFTPSPLCASPWRYTKTGVSACGLIRHGGSGCWNACVSTAKTQAGIACRHAFLAGCIIAYGIAEQSLLIVHSQYIQPKHGIVYTTMSHEHRHTSTTRVGGGVIVVYHVILTSAVLWRQVSLVELRECVNKLDLVTGSILMSKLQAAALQVPMASQEAQGLCPLMHRLGMC